MLATEAGRKLKLIFVVLVFSFSFAFIWQERTCMSDRTRNVQNGMWGGEHIGLWVEDNRARIEYDCARGAIDQHIKVDSKGRFKVAGTYLRQRGGPETAGERPDNHSASYSGQVTGQKIILTVTLTDTNEDIGTYALTYGQKPDLFKCK
jgi:hypothetical protein